MTDSGKPGSRADGILGARPMKRVIQLRLANPLLDGRLANGTSANPPARVTIDWDGDDFTFTPIPIEPAETPARSGS